MPGKRDTWTKPIPRQNIVVIRRSDRTPLSRRQRAEYAEINAEEPTDPNERNMWVTEYKLTRGLGQESTATKIQGGRKTQKQHVQAIDRGLRAEIVREMNAERVPAEARPEGLRQARQMILDHQTKPTRQRPGGRRRSTKRKTRKNRRH